MNDRPRSHRLMEVNAKLTLTQADKARARSRYYQGKAKAERDEFARLSWLTVATTLAEIAEILE